MAIAGQDETTRAAYKAGALALVIAGGAILAALAFEYIGGYLPCPLCLQQRYAYYLGVPLLFIALVFVSAGHRYPAGLIFLFVSLAFLANAGLGVYHAGVEWGFWPGPQSCAGVQELTTSAGALLESLPNANVVRCDEAPWRFAGLSFAGWNVVTSFVAFGASLRAAADSVPSN
ncbi:MAG: disulfide bond formation protein B [Hyphomicrobium sp.]